MQVNVRYVGKKAERDDNIAGTGTRWRGPGDVKPVPAAAWELLRRHPDVWALADLDDDDLVPAVSPAPQPVVQVPPPSGPGHSPALPDFVIGGQSYPHALVVDACRETAGLTVEAWNALDEAGQQALLQPFVASLQGAQASSTTAGDQNGAKQGEGPASSEGKSDMSSEGAVAIPGASELEAMEAKQLLELAKKRGHNPHPNTGKPKLIALLTGAAEGDASKEQQ